MRTPRGRMATRACYIHFGLEPRRSDEARDLFAGLGQD
jgi:hypothetical protein